MTWAEIAADVQGSLILNVLLIKFKLRF